MHSSDRTLLSRLGFSDPDRKESEHEQICQFLALRPDQGEYLVGFALGNLSKHLSFEGCDEILTEVPISKGEGQYRQTIGFADVVVKFRAGGVRLTLGVEVKVRPFSVSDVIRQINLYREHTGPKRWCDEWVLVVGQNIKLSRPGQELFRREKIFVVTPKRESFEEWQVEMGLRQAPPAPPLPNKIRSERFYLFYLMTDPSPHEAIRYWDTTLDSWDDPRHKAIFRAILEGPVKPDGKTFMDSLPTDDLRQYVAELVTSKELAETFDLSDFRPGAELVKRSADADAEVAINLIRDAFARADNG